LFELPEQASRTDLCDGRHCFDVDWPVLVRFDKFLDDFRR
jgi:hypothetical protein